MSKEYPLILVLYYDKSLLEAPEILHAMSEGINKQITAKEANVMAFFVPTEEEERIECINPIQVEETEMDRINELIEDITKHYDIGQGADEGKNDPDNEIEIKK